VDDVTEPVGGPGGPGGVGPGDGELGPIAVTLLVGGAAATIAGLTTLVPGWVLLVGLATFAVGAAVPLWAFWRRRRRADEATR
jgi:membrane protein implicated in regulation of membrane protease activity